MGLKIDEIIAVIIVCVFYTVLIGRYSIRLYKKWCNRKKKTTNIEAQNGTETTETEESSSLEDPQPSSSELEQKLKSKESPSLEDSQSSSSLEETRDIEAQNQIAASTTTIESSSLPDPPIIIERDEANAEIERIIIAVHLEPSSTALVQKPKPCVLTT
jgi:hypothetical protein